MLQLNTRQYKRGFLDGAVRMALSVCSNELGYEMSAIPLGKGRDSIIKTLSKELGTEEYETGLEYTDLVFSDIYAERFGDDEKSLLAVSALEDIICSEFGAEESILMLKNDEDIRDFFSGYSGGNAPYYIVTKLFVVRYEDEAVLFIIGTDE